MSDEDRRTVGATERGRAVLKWLCDEQQIFTQEMDAYRFAISLGLALGKRTPLVGRQTSFNVGSFDKDGAVSTVVQELMSVDSANVYRAAEEFAEAGFEAMFHSIEAGEFRFADMFELAKRATQREP